MKLIAFSFYCFFILTTTAQSEYEQILDSLKLELQKLPNGTHISIAKIAGASTKFIGFSIENNELKSSELQDSLFEIGSITKVFTATLLANEIVTNRLNPTKSINKNFNFKFNNKIKINYLELANHTSGIYRLPANLYVGNKDIDKPYEFYTNKLFDDFLKSELELGERKTYNYSNVGMALLAYSLEKKTKTDLEQLMSNIVFSKYGMISTGFDKTPSFAGLNEVGEVQEFWKFNAMKGAGGIISNVKDLSKFVQSHFNESDLVLAKTREETFIVSKAMSIGLSLHLLHKENNQTVFWHNGGTGGFTSSMMFDTEEKKGVVILSNIAPSNPKSVLVDYYCFKLLNTNL